MDSDTIASYGILGEIKQTLYSSEDKIKYEDIIPLIINKHYIQVKTKELECKCVM